MEKQRRLCLCRWSGDDDVNRMVRHSLFLSVVIDDTLKGLFQGPSTQRQAEISCGELTVISRIINPSQE
jgi:hypothetical protein